MYNYSELIDKCAKCGGKITFIGKTELGFPIPQITKGSGDVGILLVGGVHAREYITSHLLLELMPKYIDNYRIDCIPMLNIDGCLLASRGIKHLVLDKTQIEFLTTHNNGSDDFRRWKANIRAVDLNNNFDALWANGNTSTPKSSGFAGYKPFSELETIAIKRLLDANKYSLVVCYHSIGEEVYWGFDEDISYQKEAQLVADKLGYELKQTPNSYGGLKDYFTLTSKRLGLTIEIGSSNFEHPYPMTELNNLVKTHKGILQTYASLGESLWKKYNNI